MDDNTVGQWDEGPHRCVCKGIRSCLKCESSELSDDKEWYQCLPQYVFCADCGDKAFKPHLSRHCDHSTLDTDAQRQHSVPIDGLFVKTDVISADRESRLVAAIDALPWVDSQSGRRKQDFGPKINFKKQKVNLKGFEGLPQFDRQLIQDIDSQLNDRQVLKDFVAVEVCHLEYSPSNGSSIDLHFDDFWIWGQRLVTVNLLSPTVLTFVLPQTCGQSQANHQIMVHLPQRSLVVVSGDCRYKYQHCIRRQDIGSRRIAITYRELSEQFLINGSLYDSAGKQLINRSLNDVVFDNN